MDLFGCRAFIWNYIVSNSCYGMLRDKLLCFCPLERPIMLFATTKFEMAAVSPERSIIVTIYQ